MACRHRCAGLELAVRIGMAVDFGRRASKTRSLARAHLAEQVDARDLKSLGEESPFRFDSGSGQARLSSQACSPSVESSPAFALSRVSLSGLFARDSCLPIRLGVKPLVSSPHLPPCAFFYFLDKQQVLCHCR